MHYYELSLGDSRAHFASEQRLTQEEFRKTVRKNIAQAWYDLTGNDSEEFFKRVCDGLAAAGFEQLEEGGRADLELV